MADKSSFDDYLKWTDDTEKKMKSIADLSSEISALKREELKGWEDSYDLSRKITAELGKQKQIQSMAISLVEKAKENLNSSRKAETAANKILESASENAAYYANITNDAMKELLFHKERSLGLSGAEFNIATAHITKLQEQLKLKRKAENVAGEALNLAYDSADAAKEALVHSEKDLRNSQLKLDNANAHVASLEAQKQILDKMEAGLNATGAEYGKIKGLAMDIAKNPLTAMLALISAATERFFALDKAAGDFRKKTGLLIPQMVGIEAAVRRTNVEMQNIGVGLEEAYAAAGDLVEAFGVADLVTEKMIANMAQMSANLGISTKDMADFNSNFSESAKSSGTTTENIISSAASFSKLAGVPVSKVMSDVAKASGTTLSFLAKTPMKMMQAAAEARRLGTTLDKIAAAARGMLNYQTSMTDELEASALLNQNISFQASRQLAWEGKLVESREMALKQIEKAGDFTKMTVYQQEALAKAAGMTIEEVTKQQNQQKALNALRDSQDPIEKKRYDDFKKMSDGMRANEKSAEQAALDQGKEMVKQQLMQSQMNQLSNAFKSIWVSITDSLMPIVDIILPKIISGIQLISEGIKWSGKLAIPLVVAGLVAVWGLTKLIMMAWRKGGGMMPGVGGTGAAGKAGGVMSKLFGGVGKLTDGAASGFAKSAKMVARGIAEFGKPKVLLGVLSMVGMAAGLWIMAKALQAFTSVEWESLAKAGVALAGIAVIAGIMGTPPIAAAIGLGALLIAALGFALIPFAAAATIAAAAMKPMAEGLTSLAGPIKEVIPPFVSLAKWSPGLYVAAGGIAAVAASLLAFGTGSGIGSIIGKLTGGDGMVGQIILLASIGPQLNQTAMALDKIAEALVKIKAVGKLDNLSELTTAVVKSGAASAGAVAGGSGGDTGVAAKIDELIALFKNGGISVNLDGRKVSSGLSPAGR